MPTALLIADAPWVMNEIRAALAVGDWELEELADPRAAVDRVEETRPDAVIVDMQIGSMGGMAVVRAIRQEIDPATRPRMVLLLDRSADDFLARRAGADAQVLKPINTSLLRAALSPQPARVAVSEEE